MVGAVIYVRVSTKEQTENLSLPTQLRACEEYCRRQGYEILERFHEVCANNFGLDKPLKLVIPQKWRDNRHVDTEDRRPEQVCCVALSPQVSEELPIDLNYVN